MNIQTETITPEIAAKLLGSNKGNRKLDKKRVEHLAREIVMDRWELNGETIKLGGGRLLDGQHRLQAVVLAGKPIKTAVARGVDQSAFATIDQNKKRSASDTLYVNDEVNTNNLAATIRTIVDLRDTGRKWKRSNGVTPNAFFLDFLAEEPGVRDSLAAVHGRMNNVVKLSRSASTPAALHYLFGLSRKSVRDQFFQKLDNGLGIESGEPVGLLRNRLIQNPGTGSGMDRSMVMALFVKAWNATVKGQQLKQLKWLPDSEDFPVIG